MEKRKYKRLHYEDRQTIEATSVDYVALWGIRTAVPPALAQLHINGLMSMP